MDRADTAARQTDIVAGILAAHSARPDALIEILHDIQAALRHVPEAALPQIALALNLSRAEVQGVASFYHDFHSQPAEGRVLRVCVAEACKSMGADALFNAARCLPGVTVEPVYCLGNCALSPAALIDGQLLGRATFDTVREMLDAEPAA